MDKYCLPNFLFSSQQNDEIKHFRDFLDGLNYSTQGIVNCLGVKNIASLKESDIPQLLLLTSADTPLNTLIRLFLIEAECDIEVVRNAIQPMDLEKWEEVGLVRIHNDTVTAGVKLLPFQDLILAFDLANTLQTDLASHYVMGVGKSTMTLANLAVWPEAGSTLDLGSGCGTLGFLAAPHSAKVTAIDRNPRAIQITAFNAQLNGLSNIECLEGNFFEPIAGQKFDLIITNPPFVISPENRYIYRDGGMSADSIAQKIVQEAPQYLTSCGFCQMLCNWSEGEGGESLERMRKWFEGSGCDVLILRSETKDVATYASTWIKHTEKKDAPLEYLKRFNEWIQYYQKQNIEKISAGTVIMRRSEKQSNWIVIDDAPEKMLGPCGESIVQRFASRDFLETVVDDADLLKACVRISPDIRLERLAKPDLDAWRDEEVRLTLAKGLAYSADIDHFVAQMAINCNGKRPLQQLLKDMAASLEVEIDRIAPDFCKIVRGLIERGFLLPERN